MRPRVITTANMSARIGGVVARAARALVICDVRIRDAIGHIRAIVIDPDHIRLPLIAPANRANQVAVLATHIQKRKHTAEATVTAVANATAPVLVPAHLKVAAPIIVIVNFLFPYFIIFLFPNIAIA